LFTGEKGWEVALDTRITGELFTTKASRKSSTYYMTMSHKSLEQALQGKATNVFILLTEIPNKMEIMYIISNPERYP